MPTETLNKPKRGSFWRLPLLHFTAIGILIFAWDALRVKAPSQGSYAIVVTVPQVERMAGLWLKTWGRPPTDQELQGLVRDYIKEEIYYREARRLGLDQNDVVIRRRLRQKMEFLSAGSVEEIEPSENALVEYYEKNLDNYSKSAIFDFQQIYYQLDQEARAKADLSVLKRTNDVQNLGDSISLPQALKNADEGTISRIFGSKLWEEIQTIRKQTWQGPIESGFGLHLVKINAKKPAAPIPFEDVREIVERDWLNASRLEAQESAFKVLRASYSIDIEMPKE